MRQDLLKDLSDYLEYKRLFQESIIENFHVILS